MNKKLAYFIIAVAIQAMIIAAVPGKQIYTRLTGKVIMIKTAPVDPYDFLSGYHVALNYEISRPKGFDGPEVRSGSTVYVILGEDPNGVWSAQSAYSSWPKDVPAGCIVIKGTCDRSRVNYGIEKYFIPEKSRNSIEKDLRQNARIAKAQIKIDNYGNAALVKLIVADRAYEY